MAITRRGPSGWVLLLARGGEGIWRERLVEVRVREWGKFGKWFLDQGSNDGGGVRVGEGVIVLFGLEIGLWTFISFGSHDSFWNE